MGKDHRSQVAEMKQIQLLKLKKRVSHFSTCSLYPTGNNCIDYNSFHVKAKLTCLLNSVS